MTELIICGSTLQIAVRFLLQTSTASENFGLDLEYFFMAKHSISEYPSCARFKFSRRVSFVEDLLRASYHISSLLGLLNIQIDSNIEGCSSGNQSCEVISVIRINGQT